MINSLFRRFIKILYFIGSTFFPEFQVFLGYIIAKLHLNHCKDSPCICNFSFFLSSFYYRSSSWRLNMVVQQGFFSFFNCSSRLLSRCWSAKLYSKLNMVLNTCFVLRGSNILHLAFLSAMLLPYLLWWCYIILGIFHSCFAIHKLSRMRYLKSINPSIGVILVKISPKAFPKEYS